MSDSTTAILVMFNNLFHDFAVALLFASLVVLSVIYRKTRTGHGPDLAPLVRDLAKVFNKVIIGCWAAIIFGGIIRTAAYERFEWNEAAGRGQVAALVLKHVILVAIVVWGTWVQLRLRRRLKETEAPR